MTLGPPLGTGAAHLKDCRAQRQPDYRLKRLKQLVLQQLKQAIVELITQDLSHLLQPAAALDLAAA